MVAPAKAGTTAAAALALATLAGCNPVVEISGAFFPAWLLCMVFGVAAAAATRWVTTRFAVEPFVGPKPIFYFCTWLSGTLGLWLLCFSR